MKISIVFMQAAESRNASQNVVELFECAIYLQEVSDILCICFAGMMFIQIILYLYVLLSFLLVITIFARTRCCPIAYNACS